MHTLEAKTTQFQSVKNKCGKIELQKEKSLALVTGVLSRRGVRTDTSTQKKDHWRAQKATVTCKPRTETQWDLIPWIP